MKSRGILIAAVAAVATFVLVFLFFGALVSTGPVVVAARPLTPGTRITADDVQVRELPFAAHADGVYTSAEEVVGLVLAYARAPGDQISRAVIGDQAVGIASGLPKDMRAVAVKVDQSSGMFGVLRPGDRVSVIAVVDPQALGGQPVLPQPIPAAPAQTQPRQGGQAQPPEAFSALPSKAARVMLSGLRVLVVPQTFRYEEVTDENALAPVRSTSQSGVVLLEVPTQPVSVNGIQVSPPELLALLDAYARVHLALEPAGGATTDGIGVRIDQIVASAQPQPAVAVVGGGQ